MCVFVLKIEFLPDKIPLAYRWIENSIKFDGSDFFLSASVSGHSMVSDAREP